MCASFCAWHSPCHRRCVATLPYALPHACCECERVFMVVEEYKIETRSTWGHTAGAMGRPWALPVRAMLSFPLGRVLVFFSSIYLKT